MSDNSKISWTQSTWNFVTGCTKVSEGCTNCYIERTPPFRIEHRRFDKPGVGGKTSVKLHSDRLGLPLKWRKPRRVFVNSLADLFHEAVPDQFIAEGFAVMALASRHTFQLLTKRPARMRALLRSPGFPEMVNWALAARGREDAIPVRLPLPNLWIGVSVENQKWADNRIPLLLDTPAAVRWISAEPLLGPIDLSRWFDTPLVCGCGDGADLGCCAECMQHEPPGVDWVVCGGESGPGARPMHPTWARSLRDQCAAAGVPFHFKQHGEWAPTGQVGIGNIDPRERLVGEPDDRGYREVIRRVGKKAAGRVLDGRTWDEYPAPADLEVARG